MMKFSTLVLALTLGLVHLHSAHAAGRSLEALEQSRAAPELALPGTDGTDHDLAQQRGKHVLVNFWAVWCSPCRKEMPSMERLYQKLKDKDFNLLAIHVGPSLENARKFAADHGLSFPVLVDKDMAMGPWKVRGLPTTYLLGPDGRILAQATGEREWDSPEMLQTLGGFMNPL